MSSAVPGEESSPVLSFQLISPDTDEPHWAPSLPGRATRACVVTLVSSPHSQLHSQQIHPGFGSSGTLGDHRPRGARALTIPELWDTSEAHPAGSKSLGSEEGRAPSHPKPQGDPVLSRVNAASTKSHPRAWLWEKPGLARAGKEFLMEPPGGTRCLRAGGDLREVQDVTEQQMSHGELPKA